MSRGRRRGRLAAQVTVVLAAALGGCDGVETFSTAEGESYCGAVTLGRAFREGLSPRVQMRLSLQAERLDDPTVSPGRVWAWEPATQISEARTLADGLALEPIAPLAHDALGTLTFGEGRDRNAMFAIRPPAPDAEGMFAVLSLRADDRVEVRLLRAGVRSEEAPDDRSPIFGVFLLERRRGDCRD